MASSASDNKDEVC